MKASTVTIPVKKNHMEIHWHDYADKENPGFRSPKPVWMPRHP